MPLMKVLLSYCVRVIESVEDSDDRYIRGNDL